MINFDEVIGQRSATFRNALAQADPGAPVPSCPDWTAADLLTHLTDVQRRWAMVVAGRLQSPPRDGGAEAGSEPDSAVSDTAPGSAWNAAVTRFDVASAGLVAALSDAVDSEPAWTWSREHTVGWIRRRQAHEALVHSIDAELVLGEPGPIPDDLAEDGIDEVLGKFAATSPDWGRFDPSGPVVTIRSSGGRSWRVQLGRFSGTSPQGEVIDEPDFEPVPSVPGMTSEPALVEADAADLLLWLWGRRDSSVLTADTDDTVATALREALEANMQ